MAKRFGAWARNKTRAGNGPSQEKEPSRSKLLPRFLAPPSSASTYIEATNKAGNGPLHHAAATGNTKIIDMLVKEGANLEAANRMGERPLHTAAARNSLSAVQLLINQGTKTDCRDGEGKTPLHVAAEYGRSEILQYLLEIKGDMNLQDQRGMSPLHYAVMGSQTVVGILLGAGADPFLRTNDGDTPYDLAIHMGRDAAVRRFHWEDNFMRDNV
ncbi:hypothetical protein PV04_00693 [Phialophora macrospora]|uniref:Uncharacterized protein n=1 Tax=Phialophora macrospora TaxID=1851006 RepID=A0A0D2FVP0_9EURO|nr:hypothetical protein PV04_00693 [Phialophora macrospora]